MTDQLQEPGRPATQGLDEIVPRIPVHEALPERGLGNWWLPECYEGVGLGLEASVDVVSDLAYGDAGVALTAFVSMLGSVGLVLYRGDEARGTPPRSDGRGGPGRWEADGFFDALEWARAESVG